MYVCAPSQAGPVCVRDSEARSAPVAAAPPVAAPVANNACSVLSLDEHAPPVREASVPNPLPAATPGTVADGTYVLSAYTWHGTNPHDGVRRIALRLQGAELEMVYLRDAEAPSA